jgi:type I restriction enzyme M protein
MNLLLHELRQPNIVRGNALATPVTAIRRADRVDVILTNPPFGGEEEAGIQANFPEGTRTAETALLFLQVVERMLKDEGRCGIIAPNGVLFSDGVGARIKERLMRECNLHTIIRLPPGVFSPYTDIPTNLLFFEKTGRTKEVWFYELQLPEDRKRYTKTKPLRFEEFAECQAWWGGTDRVGREETEQAWRVPIAEIETGNWNLDKKNPNRPEELAHRPPEQLIKELIETEHEIVELLRAIEADLRA